MQNIQGLFSVDDLTVEQVEAVFSLATAYKEHFTTHNSFPETPWAKNKLVALVFFEPSTRTRFSFEVACQRLGLKVVSFVGDSLTSLSKGETFLDTLNNLQAMNPDLFIIRSGEDQTVKQFYSSSSKPCLNAGFGKLYHPTQALLDAFTMYEQLGELKGKKLLIVGDVEHSRVAYSNLQLLKHLGVEVATACPEEFKPKESLWAEVNNFENFSDGLKWCNSVMALRTQKERHSGEFDSEKILKDFQLNNETLKSLSEGAMIMHPGPFFEGEEILREILEDPRCAIYKQVENGVFIRAALLTFALGEN